MCKGARSWVGSLRDLGVWEQKTPRDFQQESLKNLPHGFQGRPAHVATLVPPASIGTQSRPTGHKHCHELSPFPPTFSLVLSESHKFVSVQALLHEMVSKHQ